MSTNRSSQGPAGSDSPSDDSQLSDLGRNMMGSTDGSERGSDTGSGGNQWVPPSAEELASQLPGYEIVKMLGRGGMGAVYMGRQISLNRTVAIKILSSELEDADAGFADRFKNEAQSMAMLEHPGIVAVHDFGETESGLLYIVMQYVDGTDVARMIAADGRLHTDHAMAITAHVCDALAYAHECGIIHRDIKPANIMVAFDGAVKVADFGLAKAGGGDAENVGLTQSGMIMGTMHYMAPEMMILGSSNVDHRADIYAVGVMLYHMLTGRVPHGVFEFPSLQVQGLDPRYDAIIAKAMREDREGRYQLAAELRSDLDAILTRPVGDVRPSPEGGARLQQNDGGHTVPGSTAVDSTGPTVVDQRPGAGAKRNPKSSAVGIPGWIAIGLVACALVVGGIFIATRSGSPEIAAAPGSEQEIVAMPTSVPPGETTSSGESSSNDGSAPAPVELSSPDPEPIASSPSDANAHAEAVRLAQEKEIPRFGSKTGGRTTTSAEPEVVGKISAKRQDLQSANLPEISWRETLMVRRTAPPDQFWLTGTLAGVRRRNSETWIFMEFPVSGGYMEMEPLQMLFEDRHGMHMDSSKPMPLAIGIAANQNLPSMMDDYAAGDEIRMAVTTSKTGDDGPDVGTVYRLLSRRGYTSDPSAFQGRNSRPDGGSREVDPSILAQARQWRSFSAMPYFKETLGSQLLRHVDRFGGSSSGRQSFWCLKVDGIEKNLQPSSWIDGEEGRARIIESRSPEFVSFGAVYRDPHSWIDVRARVTGTLEKIENENGLVMELEVKDTIEGRLPLRLRLVGSEQIDELVDFPEDAEIEAEITLEEPVRATQSGPFAPWKSLSARSHWIALADRPEICVLAEGPRRPNVSGESSPVSAGSTQEISGELIRVLSKSGETHILIERSADFVEAVVPDPDFPAEMGDFADESEVVANVRIRGADGLAFTLRPERLAGKPTRYADLISITLAEKPAARAEPGQKRQIAEEQISQFQQLLRTAPADDEETADVETQYLYFSSYGPDIDFGHPTGFEIELTSPGVTEEMLLDFRRRFSEDGQTFGEPVRLQVRYRMNEKLEPSLTFVAMEKIADPASRITTAGRAVPPKPYQKWEESWEDAESDWGDNPPAGKFMGSGIVEEYQESTGALTVNWAFFGYESDDLELLVFPKDDSQSNQLREWLQTGEQLLFEFEAIGGRSYSQKLRAIWISKLGEVDRRMDFNTAENHYEARFEKEFATPTVGRRVAIENKQGQKVQGELLSRSVSGIQLRSDEGRTLDIPFSIMADTSLALFDQKAFAKIMAQEELRKLREGR